MCGIGGVFSEEVPIEKKRELMTKMSSAMGHRGPHGTGYYVDEKIALVNTRLAIVGRDCESVLSWNDARTLVVSFNGEVYNYQELFKAFNERCGSHMRRDTDAVVQAIEEQGPQAVSLFVGNFAFAAWNTSAKEGFLVRDRVGIKPLYYARVGQGLVFASSIKALLDCFPELNRLDPTGLYHYMTYRFVPTPDTVFKDIKKLPAGCWLSFSTDKSASLHKYWDFSVAKREQSEEELILAGQSLIEQAVKNRVPDEVEYGALLSGGLDSSLITAIASRSAPRPLRTYSVVFLGDKQEESVSEHHYSRLAASTFGTAHTEVPVSAESFQEACIDAIFHLEEPVADPPCVLLKLVCAIASNEVAVLLSGEGADELFAGYFIYPELLKKDQSLSYIGMGRLLVDKQKRKLFSEEFLRSVGPADSLRLAKAVVQRSQARHWDTLHQMLYLDCKRWLVDDLLTKADKMGMASSVEIRVPFLDHQVVDYAFSIPSTFKINDRVRKYMLRRIAEPWLPDVLIQQPKRGFPLPLGTWLRGPLSAWVRDLLLSGLLKRDYFNTDHMYRFVERYLLGPASSLEDHIVWSLVVMELFHQVFADG